VGNRAGYVEISTRLQMLSQRYTKTAQQAVLGNKSAFAQLEDSRKAFAEGLNALIDGGAGVPSSPVTSSDPIWRNSRSAGTFPKKTSRPWSGSRPCWWSWARAWPKSTSATTNCST
jgi:hypothetical protein